ncbi:hypothetical protein ABZ172_04865 [Streptomyces sp. NPDC006296]|uniref:hypothetical protein n=1 Tax=Streptomyces sp. NPDC006296 TaxID=3156746 RepID=UPI0033A57563
MTLAAALVRLRQYGERTSTWSTATYNDGAEKALHEIALTLAAEVDRLSDELTGRSLALYEEELGTARLRLALASAKRGRREARAKLAGLRQGYAALEARCDYIAKAAVSWRKEADGRKAYGLTLRDELASYRALELGTPEGRVSARCEDSSHPVWLRDRGDMRGCPWCRVAELETALVDATEPDVDGAGRTYREYNPAPRDLRPGAEAARRMLADREATERAAVDRSVKAQFPAVAAFLAEDPHDSPLHRTHETGHDLPEVDSYRSAPLPAAAALCATCGHTGAAHHHAGTACWANLPREHDAAGTWDPIRLCPCSAFVEGAQ